MKSAQPPSSEEPVFRDTMTTMEWIRWVLLARLDAIVAGTWPMPSSNQLCRLCGGIGEKPGVVDHQIAVRQYLSVTISFDHDVIDGAPAARFIQRLKEFIERGDGLDNVLTRQIG